MQNNREFFDLICIGGGSGGLALATAAARMGKKVALIEAKSLGGTCLQLGCIPKKIMCYASQLRYQMEHWAKPLGLCNDALPSISWSQLIQTRDAYINKQTHRLEQRLETDNITFIKGWGYIIDPHKLIVGIKLLEYGGNISIQGKRLCLCTGGDPKLDSIPGGKLALNSNDFFSLKTQPNTALILGGGYIAVEFASILQQLGTQVSMLVRSKVLRHFDDDVSKQVEANLQALGINLIKGAVNQINQTSAGLQVKTLDGLNYTSSCVIAALGRKINIELLNLELDLTRSGKLKVDDHFQTSLPNIYAIGDIIDGPDLTPVAISQGRRLANLLYGEANYNRVDLRLVPTAVFTYPQVGSIGLTETEARNNFGVEAISTVYKKFIPMYCTLANINLPFLIKLVLHKATDKVLGCHLVGLNADEMIQCIAMAVSKGITRGEMLDTIALHPTLAEELVT